MVNFNFRYKVKSCLVSTSTACLENGFMAMHACSKVFVACQYYKRNVDLSQYSYFHVINEIYAKTRTPQDMDKTLPLIFAKS